MTYISSSLLIMVTAVLWLLPALKRHQMKGKVVSSTCPKQGFKPAGNSRRPEEIPPEASVVLTVPRKNLRDRSSHDVKSMGKGGRKELLRDRH